MKRTLPPLLLLLVTGCAGLPQDTEGTLDRVRAARVVRVGVIADDRADAAAIGALAARVGQAAQARPRLVRGAADPLLAALDEDRLDLVIGAFRKDSSWRPDVTLTPPVARYSVGRQPLFVRAAVRNGENRWAMLVERAARARAPDLASEG